MKKYFLPIFTVLIFGMLVHSQEVKIEGFAFNSKTPSKTNSVNVIINDTVNKLVELEHSEFVRVFKKKRRFKKYATHTNKNGKFKIKAKLTDSLFYYSRKHFKQSFLVSDLLKLPKISIKLKPLPCYDEPCNENLELIIVTGQKLKFEKGFYNYCYSISLNSEWAASYSIDSLVYGNFDDSIIDFKVSVHASQPEVQNYDNVILYIYRRCDSYIMLRNGKDPIYMTKSGKWATPVSFYYWNQIPEELRPKPKKVEFINPVIFNLDESWGNEYISKKWYEPYYTIKDKTAIANYGFYIEDAVEIRKAYIKSLKE